MKRIAYGIVLPKTINEEWAKDFAAREVNLEYIPEHRAMCQVLTQSDDDRVYSIEEVMELVTESNKKNWHPNFNYRLTELIRRNSQEYRYVAEPRIFPLYDSLIKQ
ncbi:hypothetical protein [Bacillus cereus]|uniref:hypothetical protein n=1 Tax=Bacillus cereus TaxID=1396 RepID=UPI001124DE28|nr:hypothetical protein [Bacillus cereus]